VSQFWGETRHSLRNLVRSPAFSAVAVLTLALGIGANTAIFSVVNAVLLRQLPFRHAERTVWISGVRPGRSDAPFSLPDFLDYRDRIGSLDSLSAVGNWSANLTGQGDADRLNGARVSANLFETLGVNAALGRALRPEDDRPGSPPVVVITDNLWKRRFGGDPNVVGKTLDLNGAGYTLVGILPPNFFFPLPAAELAVPLVPDADPWRSNRNTTNFLRMVGRTGPGATLEQTQAEMNVLAEKLHQQFPVSNAQKLGVKLTPMRDQITGGYRRALWVLLGAVGLVLLIACANLANLNLVRASGRRREMSIRSALGATRLEIIKLLLLESAVVAAAGCALGTLTAHFGVRALLALAPSSIPRASEIGLDNWVLAYTVLVSAVAALLTGLAPALSISQNELAQGMNEASRRSTEGKRGKTFRTGLIVAEVALSMMLLAGAGVLLKSFAKVQSLDLGFDPHRVLCVHLSLPRTRYTDVTEAARFYDLLSSRVRTLPGVAAVGMIQGPPLSGLISSINFTVVGRAFSRQEIPEALYRIVSPMYLNVMRIPLLAGREFGENDTDHTPLVCYINETLARRYFPAGNAVGAHLMLDDNDSKPRTAEVVGVIHDIKDTGLETRPTFDIYIPLRQAHEDTIGLLQDYQYWVLRANIDPLALGDTFRQQVRSVDADVAVSNVQSMDQQIAVAMGPRRFNLELLSLFAIAALALALAGIYGVVSYSVKRRTHEIGVRMALGANQLDVLWMVIADGMKPVLAGAALGILGVFALTKELNSLLFAVSATDPATLTLVTLLFCSVSHAALLLPARRASETDPLAVLRE
jgi:predicted permease